MSRVWSVLLSNDTGMEEVDWIFAVEHPKDINIKNINTILATNDSQIVYVFILGIGFMSVKKKFNFYELFLSTIIYVYTQVDFYP